MAASDLQTFLEDRLRALDPTIDLDAGSPAQTQLIEPVIKRLGTDPLETDIDAFILARFSQEFPDIYAGDPSAVRDLFIKPLILLLEPFKREIQTIKQNQSLQDPTVLSDDDADALVANIFEDRTSGSFSRGVGRVFFSNPTNVQAEITSRFFTADGLNYFPASPVSISAEEMTFNRSGSLFFMDVPVKAEKEGPEYNIDRDTLTGVVGLFGAVRVSNPRAFSDGTTRVDTPSFVAGAREALTERSLVTRRGATATISQRFQGEVRAIQVIGAKDPEMQRDILVGESPGHAWLTGQVSIYGNLALVQCRTVDDSSTGTSPVPGDTLLFYLSKYMAGFESLPQSSRTIRFVVEEVLVGPVQVNTDPFQVAFLVRWSGTPPTGVTLANSFVAEGGFAKKGTIHISSLPSIGTVDLVANNQEVHVYGHSDIYLRPVLQPVSKVVLSNLVDDPEAGEFSIQRSTLTTNGAATSNQNRITDPGFDFELAGVEKGNIVTIETGDDAGSYVVGSVTGGSPSYLYLQQNLTATGTNLRYRVTKKIRVNLFEPRVTKIPFGDVAPADLQTNIGSNLVQTAVNLTDYGVVVGDTFRILSGANAGDYLIEGFDGAGTDVLLDTDLGATETGIAYEVFTSLSPVLRPFVRVRELLLLDSSQQSTDIAIPYADPVAVVPTCSFTAAQVRGHSQRRTGVVLPSLTASDGSDDYVTGGNVAAASGDRRYSLGFDSFDGNYKAMLFADATQSEFNFPEDADTECSYFMAVAEDTSRATNYPPIDPKPGDALTLKNGPNKGSYLIEKVRKFKYADADGDAIYVYFIKIYGRFPVDVLRSLIKFLDDNGSPVTKITNASGTIAFPSFFTTAFAALGSQVSTVLTSLGAISPGASTIQSAIELLAQTDYDWGDPARGSVRSYFLSPTLFQQHTALNDNPTIYEFTNSSGEVLRYRPDPNRYEKFEIIPPRLREDTDPLLYFRDMDPTGSTDLLFTDSSNPSLFSAGVEEGDVLSIHEEVFFHDSAGVSDDRQTAVQTVAGSAVITAPSASGAVFTPEMVGDLLFIEEGVDAGGYRVSQYISSSSLGLDRPVSETTPSALVLSGILTQGSGASWGLDGSDNKITMPSTQGWDSSLEDMYVTLYGIDTAYQGTYKITSVPDAMTLIVDRPASIGDFPGSFGTDGYWVITTAPATAPVTTDSGTELHAVRPIRMYGDVPQDYEFTDITQSPSDSSGTVTAAVAEGVDQPYRVYRNNIRRVNPTEMSDNADGPLFYFDTEVVSLGPSEAHNIPRGSYLTVEEGTYESTGYRHVVDDNTLSYSTQESGFLDLPVSILPLENEDSLANFLNLTQVPIQVSYDRADIVQQLQDFLDSVEDRVTVANLLARHFLPAYVSYDATYSGGSAPSVIAKDIVALIDNLPVLTPIDVSEVQRVIEKHGGNPETPTKVIAVIHDWDRKIWAEFGENTVGLKDPLNPTQSDVPYNGTPRVSFFIPGQDVSGQDPIPAGERINLTRQ